MRFILLLAVLVPAVSAAAPIERHDTRVIRPNSSAPSHCADATKRIAQGDQRLGKRNLAELPPARAYMSVYRTVNGCEAPMTATEYRGAGRR